MPDFSICPISDLPRATCHHCDPQPRTGSKDYAAKHPAEPPPGPIGVFRPLAMDYPDRVARPDLPFLPDWQADPAGKLVCDHGHGQDTWICSACSAEFRDVVRDVPLLVAELEVAFTKQVQFLDQGAPKESDPDEATLDWSEAAASALTGLRDAFGGTPEVVARFWLDDWAKVTRDPDVEVKMAKVTEAASRAHRVIDRPPTLFEYGPCPGTKDGIACRTPLRQERVSPGEFVRCRVCGYRAELGEHQKTQVLAAQDEWHTYSEIQKMLLVAGEPLTKHAFDNLIARDGLPRESINRPRWREGQLVANYQWHYRLRDVWAMRRDQYRRVPDDAETSPTDRHARKDPFPGTDPV
jgi:hypothetical protein